jgi:hypothetical protein
VLGLLFLLLFVPIAVWAYVFRGLLRGVDVRPPLPSRRERELAERLRAFAHAGQTVAEFGEAIRKVGKAFAEAAPAVRRVLDALEAIDPRRDV